MFFGAGVFITLSALSFLLESALLTLDNSSHNLCKQAQCEFEAHRPKQAHTVRGRSRKATPATELSFSFSLFRVPFKQRLCNFAFAFVFLTLQDARPFALPLRVGLLACAKRCWLALPSVPRCKSCVWHCADVLKGLTTLLWTHVFKSLSHFFMGVLLLDVILLNEIPESGQKDAIIQRETEALQWSAAQTRRAYGDDEIDEIDEIDEAVAVAEQFNDQTKQKFRLYPLPQNKFYRAYMVGVYALAVLIYTQLAIAINSDASHSKRVLCSMFLIVEKKKLLLARTSATLEAIFTRPATSSCSITFSCSLVSLRSASTCSCGSSLEFTGSL